MKRNKFSLSHYRLFSCDMGKLIPIGLTEVLPGDTIQHATSALIRCSPLLAPVMHPVEVRIHHWFVPNRIIWDEWEDFITGGPDGMSLPAFPTIKSDGGVLESSLADYLGIPTTNVGVEVSALPFRAYTMIYNEWYRDQDLQTEQGVSKASGEDNYTNTTLLNHCWEKDYFTTSRPWTQKGPDIYLPLGESAPVKTSPMIQVTGAQNAMLFQNVSDGSAAPDKNQLGTVGSALVGGAAGTIVGGNQIYPSNLMADLTNATAVTINDLREAFAIQRYEEARARYGSRYTEYLRYLGVRSSDARLQRPEYLGGGKQTIQFSEVLQTAPGAADEPGVASMYGHGIGAMRSNRYRRFFEEHGFVISLLSVRPKTMYINGLARHWNRRSKEDYFQKELQHIGQQEVLNKEVYVAHTTPEGVFGYQDRYDDYRRAESGVAGEFRSTLNFWHYAREFALPPVLNEDFVKSVPTKRTNADQSSHCIYVMANHSIQARRIVAKLGTSFIF